MKQLTRNIAWGALAIGILLALNCLVTYFELHTRYRVGYQIRILMLVGIAIIAAVSLNIVNGFTGQFSIGHAGFFGIGAYTGAALTIYAQKTLLGAAYADGDSIGWFRGGLVLIAAMLAGGLAAALAGLIVGLPSLKLRGDYLAIVTLGFSQILLVVIRTSPSIGGSAGFDGNPYHPEVLVPPLSSFFWIFLVAVGVVAISVNLRRSVHGLALESIREDEVAAEAMGIPTTKLKVFAFVVSAFFAGVAGVLYVHYNRGIAPDGIDFLASMNYVVMIVLGGLGSVSGAVLGATVITILPQVLYISDKYRLVIYALMLIILMLVRPQGLLGRHELSFGWFKRLRANRAD